VDETLEELDRFRAILDHASEAIFIIDRETRRVVDVNETGVKWLRLARGELLSRTPDELELEFPIEPPEVSTDHLPDTRDTGRAWTGVGVHRREDMPRVSGGRSKAGTGRSLICQRMPST
jgi:PAS domain-containing protein